MDDEALVLRSAELFQEQIKTFIVNPDMAQVQCLGYVRKVLYVETGKENAEYMEGLKKRVKSIITHKHARVYVVEQRGLEKIDVFAIF